MLLPCWVGCRDQPNLSEPIKLGPYSLSQRTFKDLISHTIKRLSTEPDIQQTLNKGYKNFLPVLKPQAAKVALPSGSAAEVHPRKVSRFSLGNIMARH